MEKSLIDFAGRLRKSGLPVSSSEVLDAGRTLAYIDLEDKTRVKDSLRSVLVKCRSDMAVFDALFDLYFSKGPLLDAGNDPDGRGPVDDLSEQLSEWIDIYQPDLSLTTEMVMTGRFGPLTKLILGRSRDMGLDRMESPLQAGFFMRRFKREMALDRIRAESQSFLAEMGRRGLDDDRVEAMLDYVDRNIQRMEEELDRLIKKELAQNRFLFLRRMQEEDMAEKRLAGLSDQDVLAMRPIVERLARRLKDRLSLRLKRAKTGRLDLKNTLRHNIGFGGPLPLLRFRNKNPIRPEVVALCDVSNSVRNFSRFMLLFLYTLKEVVARVRSFIFVGDLTEVTDLFARRELNEAVSLAASGHGLAYIFRTDYGNCLAQFAEENLTVVNSRTTVFVLGDARNNYFHPRTEALKAIAEKAARLIWLNPEPYLNWRIGDSVMEAYRPYCTMVAECGNLSQLSSVIETSLGFELK